MDAEQDLVFKALADPTRRFLLDLLFQEDGRSLGALCTQVPELTRFGVMKHLEVLEQAALISTHKVGREKLHYLNPVPIQQVYDRWVSKFAQPWTATLLHLKNTLEETPMIEKPAHVFQVFIRTSPEELWQALTDGSLTPLYYFGTRIESAWQANAPYRYSLPDGSTLLEGIVLESSPPHRLVTTFRPIWMGEPAAQDVSRVTYEIEPEGPLCKLTVTHAEMALEAAAQAGIAEG
ncbi:MAG: helix-turn-helix domain-containing protein, partial [Anaerolineae bacterium]|nr:helix-turn-helix domain-containing protein [Anaerolineae bacterium]